jgi:hypothetical protein
MEGSLGHSPMAEAIEGEFQRPKTYFPLYGTMTETVVFLLLAGS